MTLYHIKIQITFLILLMLLAPPLFSKQDKNELNLTIAERTWLNNHKVIRLASDNAWPPFEWINSDKKYQGIAADYIRLIENKLGIVFEIEKDKPWPEVVEAVKKYQLDVFSCVAKNPQRLKYVNFTRPYLSFPMVIITNTNVNYIDGINDLKSMHVSVVKGYATHEYLSANHPEIKLYLVKTSEDGLEAVSQGKVNAFVDNIATATSIIQTRGLTNLKISGEMPIRYELSMAVRKDWPELINILQIALDSISDEQRKNIHNKWIGVRYEHGFDYSLFWKSLIIFLLIIILFYFYNRKLSQEINHRKLAEKSAMNARDEANKASKAKSEFLSVVSHELRTPLTSIKGALGLLTGTVNMNLSDKEQKLLHIAHENSNRLAILVDDILDIEKLLAGKFTFQKNNIEIGKLIHKATTANQSYADQYGVPFSIELGECETCYITADENRLMQVLSNLISNAIKYSPENGTVQVTAQCMTNKARISITDQGEGIPIEFRKHIFSHFSQADSSDTREKGGTGLGLAISKEIIERQGGNIGFTSPPRKGATFYFEFDKHHAEK